MSSSVAFHTLGCKLNFAESSDLLRQFVEAGYSVVDFHQKADIYVINTCTVTAIAEKKCRTVIRQAIAQNPQAIVAVIGCFAQNNPKSVAQIEGVSYILGNHDKHKLLEYIQSGTVAPQTIEEPRSFNLAYSSSDRTRTFFKVQDGCDYFCTYCAIPFARGRSRSATVAETVAMARQIARSGSKEVVLTGVNTGTFGIHQGETFLELLRALDAVECIERYRISSIEPNLITDEIIDFVATSRAFLPHFHIPLQSGSDKVLKIMHRHYDTALYANKLERIKSVMPDACIAADIMAGFNGEDETEFQKVCQFVESLPISYLHVFTYSDRPNTAALKLGEKIPMNIRRQHSQALHDISDHKKKAFYESQIGKERTVLWESTLHTTPAGDMMQGWTDNYIRLQRPYNASLIGAITPYPITPETIVADFETE